MKKILLGIIALCIFNIDAAEVYARVSRPPLKSATYKVCTIDDKSLLMYDECIRQFYKAGSREVVDLKKGTVLGLMDMKGVYTSQCFTYDPNSKEVYLDITRKDPEKEWFRYL